MGTLRRRSDTDGGFTAAEFVAVLALMGLVFTALLAAMGMSVTVADGEVGRRLGTSADLSRANVTVPADFRNAATVAVSQCSDTKLKHDGTTCVASGIVVEPAPVTVSVPPDPARSTYSLPCSSAQDEFATAYATVLMTWSDTAKLEDHDVKYSFQRSGDGCRLVRLEQVKESGTTVVKRASTRVVAENLVAGMPARVTSVPDDDTLVLELREADPRHPSDAAKADPVTITARKRVDPAGASGHNEAPNIDFVVRDPSTLAVWPAPYKLPFLGGTLSLRLDATGTTDTDSPIDRFNWSLPGAKLNGGGSTVVTTGGAANAKVDVRFETPGTFELTLDVYDNEGGLATRKVVFPVGVNAQPSVSGLTYTARARGVTTGHQVDFVASASDPDGDSLTFRWVFGDGGTATTSGPTVMHEFPTWGDWTTTVSVTDSAGGVSSPVMLNNVRANPKPCTLDPVADTYVDKYNASKSYGAGKELLFTDRWVFKSYYKDILIRFDPKNSKCREGYNVSFRKKVATPTAFDSANWWLPTGNISMDFFTLANGCSCTHEVYAAAKPWTESSSWNNIQTGSGDSGRGISVGELEMWGADKWANYRDPILGPGIVNWWQNPTTTYGVVISDDGAETGDRKLASREYGDPYKRPLLLFDW